jgi:hypothetical protein
MWLLPIAMLFVSTAELRSQQACVTAGQTNIVTVLPSVYLVSIPLASALASTTVESVPTRSRRRTQLPRWRRFCHCSVAGGETIAIAGMIGNRIWHLGARLVDFEPELIGVTVLLAVIALAPLCFCANQLSPGRRTAHREFGALASRCVNEFPDKWTQGGNGPSEPLLGSDLQSLADLGNAYTTVTQMRALPFSGSTLLRLVILIVSPVAPLVLTVVPIKQLIERLVRFAL